MQLSDIRTGVRVLINEPSTVSNKFFTDTEINFFINEAYRDMLAAYLMVMEGMQPEETDATANSADGTDSYAVPANCWYLNSIIFTYSDGIDYIIPVITEPEIRREYTALSWAWATKKGCPKWAYKTRNKIILKPTPDYSGTGNIKILYKHLPVDKTTDITAVLSADASVPSDIPTRFHGKLIHLPVWAYHVKRGHIEDANAAMANHLAAVASIKSAFDVDYRQTNRSNYGLFETRETDVVDTRTMI